MQSAVLLIEDDLPTRLILQTNMEQWGYKVVSAETGEEALGFLGKGPFSAILLDHSLPGMDGSTLGLVFKNHDKLKRIPILFMSASEEVLASCSANFEGVFSKPVPLESLRKKLAELT